VTLVNDLAARRYLHAAFSGVNAVITLYVMLNLHGILATVSDVFHDLHDWVYRPVGKERQTARAADWVTVLYHGTATSGETEGGAAVANALAAIDQESNPESEILFRVHEPVFSGAPRVTAPVPERLAEPDVQALASALSESIRDLRPGNTLTVSMTPEGLKVGHGSDDHGRSADERA
jgi:hypothetical protein